MRDNGLPAQEWTHVADLDPRVADAALEALREAGVAAYAMPHPGRAGPYLDVQLPDRPTDQLYVESAARERAVAVLADLERSTRGGETGAAPALGHSPAEVDATFAEIVSQFGVRTTSREPDPHDSVETTDRDDPSPTVEAGRLIRGTVGWDDLLADRDATQASGARDADDADDADEGYVPPPPPPVPRGTPLRRFAWLAVLGAPVVVVVSVFASYGLDGWVGLLVVGAFLGGLGTLFATLDDRHPDDDDPDHGAVV